MDKPKVKALNEEHHTFGTLKEAITGGKVAVSRDKRMQDLPDSGEVFTPWIPMGRRVKEEGGT